MEVYFWGLLYTMLDVQLVPLIYRKSINPGELVEYSYSIPLVLSEKAALKRT